MNMTFKTMLTVFWVCFFSAIFFSVTGAETSTEPAMAEDARAIVDSAVNYLREDTSESVVHMTIHRPDWERTMTIKAWTKGKTDSIFRIESPPKDKGNGTLKKGKGMWIFNPKVNRVIKLPPSMMSQSWQGSDFSNNDLAKSDTVIDDYDHEIIGTETRDGKTVYVIQSIPKPDAPVVWGMQKLIIREDFILLRQEFYDEDMEPVKILSMKKIGMIGGKLYPMQWQMAKADAEDEYTRIDYESIVFNLDLSEHMFTISNLKKP
jgi:outer membrane lipoprotein-sorting protein